jgi:hypothetical protein
MSEAAVIWSTAAAVIGSVGGGAVLVLAFSSWLGKVWANRIADAERARFSQELEGYRAQLQRLADEHRDALTRKRDIYARIATSMRVFLASRTPASDAQKAKFLAAFDLAALWASEEVATTLADFLNLSVRSANNPGTVTNVEFKDAYRACLNAMRRDCGFPGTAFNYPVVTFH